MADPQVCNTEVIPTLAPRCLGSAAMVSTVSALCVAGAYVLSSSIFDIWVTLCFGVLGFLMRKFGYPAAPLLIGFILGPLLEINLRQALVISNGDFSIFVTRPLSILFLVLSTAALVYIVRVQRRLRSQPLVDPEHAAE